MSIVKNRLKKLFTQIPNAIITDLNISAPALRMYLYISSKNDGWVINNKDIMKQLGIGSNNSISKYWKQLIDAGWVSRERMRDDKGKFLNEYEYTLYEYPISGNLSKIAKSAKQDNPKSQNLLITKNSYLGENAIYNNKDITNKKEDINNNSLSISLKQKNEKEREKEFKNLSFKEFRINLIDKYSGYVFIKYKDTDKFISLSDSGYIELNSKITNAEKSFELWDYLYKNRAKLKPISKKELENILMSAKKEKVSKNEAIKQKIEMIKDKYFLNVLTGRSCPITLVEILENSLIKVQFEDLEKRFVLNAKIDDFLKYDKYRLDNGFLWVK